MEKKRVLRHDSVSLPREYSYKRGVIAIVVKENISDNTFKINNKSYLFPNRDFIILAKRLVKTAFYFNYFDGIRKGLHS